MTPTQVPCLVTVFTTALQMQMEAGVKPIEQVRAGNRVQSRDPKTGAFAVKRVLSTSKRFAKEVLTVHLSDSRGGKEVQAVADGLSR